MTAADASVIRDIAAASFTEVALVAVVGGRDVEPGLRRQRRRRTIRRPALRSAWWHLYLQLDRWRTRLADDPFKRESWRVILPDVEIIDANKLADRGNAEVAVAGIVNAGHEAPLDVLVNLARSHAPNFGSAARYGLWAFQYGDADHSFSGSPWGWEVVTGIPVSAVALWQFGGTAGCPRILAKAFFATDTGSVTRNMVQPSFGSSHLVVQKLRELHERGWESLLKGCETERTLPMVSDTPPTLADLAAWLGPRLRARAARAVTDAAGRPAPKWEWRIGVRSRAEARTPTETWDPAAFVWIRAQAGHMYADPFFAERNGRTWLFFEDYEFNHGKGVISCAELTGTAQLGPAKVVLSRQEHLSYPYVFFDASTGYMIPENSRGGSVGLYRCVRFPGHWEHLRDLYDAPALDKSVCRAAGRWWFFTTFREPRGGAMMLFLFHAAALGDPWEPHPMNPISSDLRNVRGAGHIFRDGGRLLRPSQDCSRAYGYRFTLYEIVTLTTTEYQERPFLSVEPTWHPGVTATHTYGRSSRYEVIDGRTRRDH